MDDLIIRAPHVPFGPKGVPQLIADADYLADAARNISAGHQAGGSNVTATVVGLLHDVARAMREVEDARRGYQPRTELYEFAQRAKAYVPHDAEPGERATRHFSQRVRDLQIVLMETWGVKDANSAPSKYPTSYIETFLDMAVAVDEYLTAKES
ncbi:hypothetical protein [Herbiconiux sp.]|uniref:hypothetical protein n=1 Tax=Herbiconiux sp. TaxID=1871186 RepID=UPI0025B8184F|nr:hypothetical protein [Herbiconiux sp.]